MRKGIISALLVISCSAPIDYFGNEVNIKSDRIYLIKMRKDKSNKDMYTLVFVEQRGNPTKSSLNKRKVTLNRYIDLIMSINGYTEKNIIEDSINQGKDLLFDIDWQGAQQLREKMGEDVVSVFILPPSKKELEKRLKNRGQDSDLVVKNRMDEASSEITHWAEYDYLIINDNLDQSVSDVLSILKAERMKRIRQIGLAEFTRSIIDDA